MNFITEKVTNVANIEKRINKIFRDLDINNLWTKVKLKANDDDFKRAVLQLENRLN